MNELHVGQTWVSNIEIPNFFIIKFIGYFCALQMITAGPTLKIIKIHDKKSVQNLIDINSYHLATEEENKRAKKIYTVIRLKQLLLEK